MKKKLFLFLCITGFLFFARFAGFTSDTIYDETSWIGKIPGVSTITSVDQGSSIVSTYSFSGDSETLINKIRTGLKEKGWVIKSDSNVGISGMKTYTLKAQKGEMIFDTNLNPSKVFVVTVTGSNQVSSNKKSIGSSKENSKKKAISGNVMDSIEGDYYVPSGKEMALMGTLDGNLTVEKNATVKIMAVVNGKITNYGNLTIMGEINGDVINIGGSVNNLGNINGKIIEK